MPMQVLLKSPSCLHHTQHCIQTITRSIGNQSIVLRMGQFELQTQTRLTHL